MPAQNPPLGKQNYGGMGYAGLQPLLLEQRLSDISSVSEYGTGAGKLEH